MLFPNLTVTEHRKTSLKKGGFPKSRMAFFDPFPLVQLTQLFTRNAASREAFSGFQRPSLFGGCPAQRCRSFVSPVPNL